MTWRERGGAARRLADRERSAARVRTSVLVVGTGGAGLRAAIELAERGVPVVAVGKRPAGDTVTSLASAGVNVALGSAGHRDSWRQHVADTLVEGRLLADPRMVAMVCEGAARGIADLERFGMRFDRDPAGRLALRSIGWQAMARAASSGESTGLEIQRTLLRRATELRVPVLDTVYVTRLLTAGGNVVGAFGFGLDDGTRYVFEAEAVVVAAGGHTGIWLHSSSRFDESTGDSLHLAVGAGARIRDPEFVQFDLLDEMSMFGDDGLHAAPAAHYALGGIRVRAADGGAGVPGLYAVGEAASGMHGASRLAGNALIEVIVAGRVVGAAAGAYATGPLAPGPTPAGRDEAVAAAHAELDAVAASNGPESARTLQREVRTTMATSAGEQRDGPGLRSGLAAIDAITERLGSIGVHPDVAGPRDLAVVFDLRSSVVAARATLDCAAARRESRGCHQRSDFPATDPSQQVNLVWSGPGTIEREPVAPPPPDIAALMGAGPFG